MKKISILCVLLAVLMVGIGLFLFQEQSPNDACPPAIMVNNRIYFTYHEKADVIPSQEQIAGHINSYVDLSELPEDNNQSNFPACVDQPYAFVEGQLLLYYDGQWNVCQ